MISVVCVYNNSKKFEENLLQSLKQQDAPYELISIDNTLYQNLNAQNTKK